MWNSMARRVKYHISDLSENLAPGICKMNLALASFSGLSSNGFHFLLFLLLSIFRGLTYSM